MQLSGCQPATVVGQPSVTVTRLTKNAWEAAPAAACRPITVENTRHHVSCIDKCIRVTANEPRPGPKSLGEEHHNHWHHYNDDSVIFMPVLAATQRPGDMGYRCLHRSDCYSMIHSGALWIISRLLQPCPPKLGGCPT